MTATELLNRQMESSGKMISKCLTGIETASPESRATASSMSLGEQVSHLSEAYQATITICDGGKHEWGSYVPKGETLEEMIQEMKDLRGAAVSACLHDSDERLNVGADYIVGHENYHLGQLVTLRLVLQPEWNSYEIYG